MVKKIKFKTTLTITIAFVLISCVYGCVDEEKPNVGSNIVYVDVSGGRNYTSIQEAIDNCKENSTIKVLEGTYFENIVINTTVKIIAMNLTNTIIDGEMNGDVIQIVANDVTIYGFTIRNSGKIGHLSDYDAGIEIISKNNIIKNCLIIDNLGGFDVRADNNTILNCSICNNSAGIYSIHSSNNSYINDTFDSNVKVGLFLHFGSNNKIFDRNNFDNNPIGLKIKGSKNNEIVKNIFQNNEQGLYFCCGSTKNMIYHNTFINNTVCHGEDLVGENEWYNDTIEEGNYWGDYIGDDADGDGIGDTPYNVTTDGTITDIFPLIKPIINDLLDR